MNKELETPAANSVCPACGARFACGVTAGQERCWCMELPAGLPLPGAVAACYCPDCLVALRSALKAAPDPDRPA